MRDFTIKEAADEAASNFPGIPKDVVRHICETVISRIVGIIKEKKGRVRLQHADIHTIYYDIVPDEMQSLLADLDESRVLTKKEEDLHILNRHAKAHLPGEIKRLNRRYRRIHDAGVNTSITSTK